MVQRIYLAVLAAGLLISGETRAQIQPAGPVNQPGVPSCQVETREIDLGVLKQSTKREVNFHLTNRGTAPLIVTTTPDCGCTVVEPRIVLAEGEKYRLVSTLDVAGLRGKFEKSIRLQTNDPKQPEIQLVIKGECLPTVAISKETPLTFSLNLAGESRSDLKLEMREDATLINARMDAPWVNLKLEQTEGAATEAGLKIHKYAVTFSEQAPFGRRRLDLVVDYELDGKQSEEIFQVSISRGLLVPDKATMKLSIGESNYKGVLLLSLPPGDYDILVLESNVAGLKHQSISKSGSPARQFRLLVPARQLTLPEVPVLKLKTNIPGQESLSIPLEFLKN